MADLPTADWGVRRGLDVLLDPIVFGVVTPTTPRPGEPSLWFPLVGWWW